MPKLPSDCPDGTTALDTIARCTEALKRYRMCAPGDRLLVGVSGGPDSVALLHLLHAIAPTWPLTLAVAHLDHAVRPDSSQSARFVADLAGSLGLPCHQATQDVPAFGRRYGMSVETAGRAVRYAYYSDLCVRHGYDRVAVGHHQDDSAEQMVMNLSRGTGATGLTGIAPVREGWVIRPLIDFSRADILAYLGAADIGFIRDPTNEDRRMRRNRVRHDILPVMARHLNPRITAALSRTAAIVGAENEWMDAMADSALTAATTARDGTSATLAVSALSDHPLALQRRIIRHVIAQLRGHLRRIEHGHIDAVLALMRRPGGTGERHLPDRILAIRRYDRLTLTRCDGPLRRRQQGPAPVRYRLHIEAPQAAAAPVMARLPGAAGGGSIAFSMVPRPDVPRRHSAGHCIAFFDMKKLDFPLILRAVAPGDRFQPLGMPGTQKVYRMLKNEKIPTDRRPLTPVLESGGRIIWVPGVKMAQTAAVETTTRHTLRGEFILPSPEK